MKRFGSIFLLTLLLLVHLSSFGMSIPAQTEQLEGGRSDEASRLLGNSFSNNFQSIDGSTPDISPIYNQSKQSFNGSNLFDLKVTQPNGHEYYQLITNMAGTIQASQKIITSQPIQSLADIPAEFINSNTILSNKKYNISLWNIDTNVSQVFNYPTHHDSEYNPLTQTFMTLQQYLVKHDTQYYVYDR